MNIIRYTVLVSSLLIGCQLHIAQAAPLAEFQKRGLGALLLVGASYCAKYFVSLPKSTSHEGWRLHTPEPYNMVLLPILGLFGVNYWLNGAHNAENGTENDWEAKIVGRIAHTMGILFFTTWIGRVVAEKFEKKKDEGPAPKSMDAPKVTNHTFKDIAGEIPEELKTVIDLIRNPEKFERVGAVMPKGYLLEGPPGNGKTALARALAGEAGIPFLNANCSSFIDHYVGSGSKAVRELFAQARELAQSSEHKKAIVFLDEIDAIGLKRGGLDDHVYRETLLALLEELDGFYASNIIVLAATNRPNDLDPALLRTGRIDGIIHVPLPDEKKRLAILEHYWNKLPSKEPLHDGFGLASRMKGKCAADIETAVKQAALRAAREEALIVTNKHLREASSC